MILLSEVRKTSLPFVVTVASLCLALSSCSRENRDWRSAQAADSLESYDQFLQRHPDSELAAQARARLLQLTEERDWQRASTADTADAYSQFLNQHPSGKWSAEGRIRLENFSLEGQPVTAAANQSAVVEPRSTAPSQTATRAGTATATATNANVPAAVPTSVTQSASSTESFGIQLGAFSSEAKANSEWQRLQSAFTDELGALEPHIVSASTSAGILFRLQSRLANEAKAREVCAALAQKSQGCVVVLPQH